MDNNIKEITMDEFVNKINDFKITAFELFECMQDNTQEIIDSKTHKDLGLELTQLLLSSQLREQAKLSDEEYDWLMETLIKVLGFSSSLREKRKHRYKKIVVVDFLPSFKKYISNYSKKIINK